MNHLRKITLLCLVFISMSCQRQASLSVPVGGGEEQTGSETISLCPDGTLNCLIDSDQANIFTNLGTGFQQLYSQCVTGCQAAGGTAADCTATCSDLTSVPDDTYASHELKIPDQAKAIEVEIRACLGPVIHNSIQFQGPQVSFVHYESALSKTMGMASKPDPVGLGKFCGIEGLNNKVEVKWKPVTSTSVSIKNVPHKVVPFTNGTEITRKYGFPVAAPFGVPFEYRDEINLNQSAWVQSKVRTSVNTTVVNNFQYLNNDTGLGYSYVHIFPMLHWAPVVISMVLFVEDASVAQ